MKRTTTICDWCANEALSPYGGGHIAYARFEGRQVEVAPDLSYTCGDSESWDFCSDICLQLWKDHGRKSKTWVEERDGKKFA